MTLLRLQCFRSCLPTLSRLLDEYLHPKWELWHGYSGEFSCVVARWRVRFPVFRNVLPHTWHLWLASTVVDGPSRIKLDVLVSGAIVRKLRGRKLICDTYLVVCLAMLELATEERLLSMPDFGDVALFNSDSPALNWCTGVSEKLEVRWRLLFGANLLQDPPIGVVEGLSELGLLKGALASDHERDL